MLIQKTDIRIFERQADAIQEKCNFCFLIKLASRNAHAEGTYYHLMVREQEELPTKA